MAVVKLEGPAREVLDAIEGVVKDSVKKWYPEFTEDTGIILHPMSLESELDYEMCKNARVGDTLGAVIARQATEQFHQHTKRYDVWIYCTTWRKYDGSRTGRLGQE